MSFAYDGFDDQNKLPKIAVKIVFGAGRSTAGASTLLCLLVGMKTASGTMVANQDVVSVTTEDEADQLAGPGSQLASMAYAALAIPGVRLRMLAVLEPAGTPATATFLLTSAGTTSGMLYFHIAGFRIAVAVNAGDTLDTIGANIVAAVNAKTRLPVMGGYNAATDTVTFTCKNVGLQGRSWLLRFDKSQMPAGFAYTLMGGASAGPDRVFLGAGASGTGIEDLTVALSKIASDRYARIAAAQNDATNAGLWRAQVRSKAAATKLRLEHVQFASNGNYSDAQTLATSLNEPHCQVLWSRNAENHPSQIAAVATALYAVTEAGNPHPRYRGTVLPGLTAHVFDGDSPSEPEQRTALDNGVTPLATVAGDVRIIRGITSYCLNGTQPDFRVLDRTYPVFVDYASLTLSEACETEFMAENESVGPNPSPEEDDLPSGVAFPKLFDMFVMGFLKAWYRRGWIENPEAHPPVSEYNPVAKRIEALSVDLYVRPPHMQAAMVIRQVNPT